MHCRFEHRLKVFQYVSRFTISTSFLSTINLLQNNRFVLTIQRELYNSEFVFLYTYNKRKKTFLLNKFLDFISQFTSYKAFSMNRLMFLNVFIKVIFLIFGSISLTKIHLFLIMKYKNESIIYGP